MSTLRNPQWGNEAFALRYKQVDSLRQYFPTLKEITKDGVYDIAIVLPSRKTINLRIMLGPEFPYQPPTLQIIPQVVHRFVNEQSYVMPQIHEKLATWNLHTNLGKTVYEITQKIIQDQPQVVAQTLSVAQQQPQQQPSTYAPGYPNTGEPPPPYASGGGGGPNITPRPLTSSTTATPPPPSVSHIRTPAIPTSFPELEQKTVVELTELLGNEDQFQALFEGLEVVKTMRQLRDELRDGNEDLAKKNVARAAEVDELRKLLNSKKDTLSELKAALDQKGQRQQQIMHQLSPVVLVERLAEAAGVAEGESEEIATAFLDGSATGMDYKEFIKKFTEKRKLYHLRAAKKESTIMSLNMKR